MFVIFCLLVIFPCGWTKLCSVSLVYTISLCLVNSSFSRPFVLRYLTFQNMIYFVDTYVKLTLLNSMGQEMSKCKTSIRRGQPNPVYKETFVFQVALFQLSDVTLILSVYNKRSMKRKEMIGWISLGLNSSGEDELNHWTEMKESKGQQVCRWHTLLES